jgi:hypothetical protein
MQSRLKTGQSKGIGGSRAAGLRQNLAIVVVPSSAVGTAQLGGIAALTMGIDLEQTIKEAGTLHSESVERPLPKKLHRLF